MSVITRKKVESAMKRTTRNFSTDLVLFAQVSSLVLTGILLKFVLPPGSEALRNAQHITRR
jgi:hypothetical protein